MLALRQTSRTGSSLCEWGDAMSLRFGNIVSATPKKLDLGLVKSVAAADRGSLEVSPQEVEFIGRKPRLSLTSVLAVAWLRPQWPRLQILGVIALAAAAVWVFIGSEQGWVKLLWAAILVPAALVWLWKIVGTKWVQVDYPGELGSRTSAYLADGSYRGFGGLMGGTRDLYDAIWAYGPGGAPAPMTSFPPRHPRADAAAGCWGPCSQSGCAPSWSWAGVAPTWAPTASWPRARTQAPCLRIPGACSSRSGPRRRDP